jgi:hypothetical protein
MRCRDCPFYKEGYLWNGCGITGDEYFHMQDDCDFVNNDGSQNEENINKIFGE